MTVERGHLWGSGVGRRGEHLHAEGHAAKPVEREYLPMGSNQKQSTVISGTQLPPLGRDDGAHRDEDDLGVQSHSEVYRRLWSPRREL